MYTKKQHIIRKSLIIGSSFLLGIATTAIAAAVYDANIQSRADAMFATIESNAHTISASDRPAYYSLVRMNISSLIQVLTLVDDKVSTKLGAIPGFDDGTITKGIAATGATTNTGTTTPPVTTAPTPPAVVVSNEDIIIQLAGVPCGSGGCTATRGQKIDGTYKLSSKITSTRELTCRVWNSTNARKDSGNEYMFLGGATNFSTKQEDQFSITMPTALDVGSSDVQVRCDGYMNGQWQNLKKIQTLTLPTVARVSPTAFGIVANKTTDILVQVDYNIPASSGYKSCAITVGDPDIMTIQNGTVITGNGMTSGLGSSDTGFQGSRSFGFSNDIDSYLNFYCAKVANATWFQFEKIIPSTKWSSLLATPISTITVSPIPGNTTSTASCSLSMSSTNFASSTATALTIQSTGLAPDSKITWNYTSPSASVVTELGSADLNRTKVWEFPAGTFAAGTHTATNFVGRAADGSVVHCTPGTISFTVNPSAPTAQSATTTSTCSPSGTVYDNYHYNLLYMAPGTTFANGASIPTPVCYGDGTYSDSEKVWPTLNMTCCSGYVVVQPNAIPFVSYSPETRCGFSGTYVYKISCL